jgi:glycerol uptake facilitator-like aquaporin
MAEIKARAPAPGASPLYSPEDGNHTAVSMSKLPSEDPIALGNNASDASPIDTGCTWLPGAYRPRASLLQKVGAELIATFVLVFGGCGAVMVNAKSGGQVTHVGVALAFGLAITIMIYAVGHISGAHMNPAVTIAFATARHFPWKQVPAYLGAQITGAIASAYVLRLILNNDASEGASLPAGSNAQSLILEIIITFILMFVISAVATDTRAVSNQTCTQFKFV